MRTRERTLRSEQGAVFVQVGISLFVLMAFNVFVLDYGMMWIGRRQAQNAADAGALAGAVARGYDDFDDPPSSSGLAHDSAEQVAIANLVWQQAGTPVVTFDCPSGVTGRCVRVDVYRDGTNGSTALPTLFGPILGITSQKVKASATSILGSGNATDCLRPIAFADEWLEGASNNQFNGYIETGPNAGQLFLPASDRDSYTAPGAAPAGPTGMTRVSTDLGERIIWELDRQTTTAPFAPITRGLVVALNLPGAGTFEDKLRVCNGQLVQLRQTLPVQIPPAGDTEDALDWLITQDSGVTWNESQNRIENSCAPGCASISPRLIPVALFDPDRFQLGRALNPPDWTAVGCPTNSPCITVTNIVGFFVHGPAGSYGPHGHFVKYPGMTSSTAPTFVDDASWMVTTHLIR
jgi:hypothetical protein